jgi:hypothetical protein
MKVMSVCRQNPETFVLTIIVSMLGAGDTAITYATATCHHLNDP